MKSRQILIDQLHALERKGTEEAASLTKEISEIETLWAEQSSAARKAEIELARTISKRTFLVVEQARLTGVIEVQLRALLPVDIQRALQALPRALQMLRERGAHTASGYGAIFVIGTELLDFYGRLKTAHTASNAGLREISNEILRLAFEIPEVKRALTEVSSNTSEQAA